MFVNIFSSSPNSTAITSSQHKETWLSSYNRKCAYTKTGRHVIPRVTSLWQRSVTTGGQPFIPSIHIKNMIPFGVRWPTSSLWGKLHCVAVHIYITTHWWTLTLILLTWRIWWAPNSANKWQMGFNSVFKGLKGVSIPTERLLTL